MYTDPEGLYPAMGAAVACAKYLPCAAAGATVVYIGAKCVEAGQAIGDIIFGNTAAEPEEEKEKC